jgi:hypothetical protein
MAWLPQIGNEPLRCSTVVKSSLMRAVKRMGSWRQESVREVGEGQANWEKRNFKLHKC